HQAIAVGADAQARQRAVAAAGPLRAQRLEVLARPLQGHAVVEQLLGRLDAHQILKGVDGAAVGALGGADDPRLRPIADARLGDSHDLRDVAAGVPRSHWGTARSLRLAASRLVALASTPRPPLACARSLMACSFLHIDVEVDERALSADAHVVG